MKQKTTIKSYLLIAAAAFGLAASAPAQNAAAAAILNDPDQAPAAATVAPGLLGSNYIGASYDYFALHGGGPNHAQGLNTDLNLAWLDHLDVNLGYRWARTNESAGRLTSQAFDLGGTTFTSLAWGKPFLLGAVGWDWEHGATANDHSFFYKLGLGVELPVAAKVTVTPFANFVRATHFNENETDFGVTAEYRITRNWGLSARLQYDAVRHGGDRAEYAAGVNYHF